MGRPAQKKGKDAQEAWENDIQMVPKLQPIMEDDNLDYPLKLKEPAELMELFESLEEQNLFLIRQQQENESVLEAKKQEFDNMDKHFELELSELRTTQNNLKHLSEQSSEASQQMQKNTIEGGNKTMDPQ